MPYTKHSRSFQENRYVYPVLSRRSRGISVGINLNPDKVCNFNCIYCQVERNTEKGTDLFSPGGKINLSPFPVHQLSRELKETLDLVKTGRIFSIPPFDKIPAELRHLSDIAISGDGEPTMVPFFYEVIEEILKVRKEWGHFPYFREDIENMGSVPIVLITNASGLNRPKVQDALDILYQNNGEVWAKLDAGSDVCYRKVSRTHIPFGDIVRNLIATAQRHPLVIQSCFNRINNQPPQGDEIERYCQLLKRLIESGGRIRLVQIYTVARPPAEDDVTPLSGDELNFIAWKVQEIASLPSEVYP